MIQFSSVTMVEWITCYESTKKKILGKGQQEEHIYTWRNKLGHIGKGLVNFTEGVEVMPYKIDICTQSSS